VSVWGDGDKMEKEEELEYVGVCCNKCFKGVMKSMPEQILEDDTVVHTAKCNVCGNIEKIESKPRQSVRRTGIKKCDKCGYEYFYNQPENTIEEILEWWKQYSICPNCGVEGYQMKLMEHYGLLKHEHGNYGMHPITRKHRKVDKMKNENEETVNKKFVPEQMLTFSTSGLSKMQKLILELTTKIELIDHDGDQIWYDLLAYMTYHITVNKCSPRKLLLTDAYHKERMSKYRNPERPHKNKIFRASFSRSLHRLEKRGLIEFYFSKWNTLKKYPDGIKPQLAVKTVNKSSAAKGVD